MKKIALVAATVFEIAPFSLYLKERHRFKPDLKAYALSEDASLSILVTGVGMTNTALYFGQAVVANHYDFAIHAGVAGAFNRSLAPGEVVEIVSDQYGDLGVEEADGSFTDMHTLNLIPPNIFPFTNGKLINLYPASAENIKKIAGLTVNKVHGFPPRIDKIYDTYKADVETMESAAFFQTCLLAGIPFLELRAISNYVEKRNRANWQMDSAINNLNHALIEVFKDLINPSF